MMRLRPRATGPSGARMHDALITYFSGEKQAGLLLTGLGILGLAAAVIFVQPRWGLRSFGITLAVFALIEMAIGVGLYLRAGPHRALGCRARRADQCRPAFRV